MRAFFLFDRTGDPRISDAIRAAADGWNSAREVLPKLPYIAVYEDEANVGKCFVNQTPGYSVATACVIPKNIEGVKGLAARNPDAQGHLIGAAMAVSDGLTADETFTAVCHTMGHIMGLENSTDPQSCMSHEFGTAKKWYTNADAAAILSVYDHSDTAGTTTSSSSTTVSPPSSTSTSSTTTSSSTSTTSSTSTSTTSTSTTLLPPITLPTSTTTTTAVGG